MQRTFEYLLLAAFIAGLTIISWWIGQQAYTWLPPQATAEAQRVDALFSLLTSIGAFILLGLVGMMLYSVVFFRARPEDFSEGHPARGSAKLEILWMVAPTLVVLWIASQNINIYDQLNVLGLKRIVHLHLDAEPANAAPTTSTPKSATEQIEVIAKQWSWSFRYPNQAASQELHLPVNQSTRLSLRAEDVIHGFYVPEFRLKQDIVPGRQIALVVTPTRVGQYRLKDSQFSGTYFALMETNVYVESAQAYNQWLVAAANSSTVSAESEENRAVAEALHPPKTLLRTGWYTGLQTDSSVANSPNSKEGKS